MRLIWDSRLPLVRTWMTAGIGGNKDQSGIKDQSGNKDQSDS